MVCLRQESGDDAIPTQTVIAVLEHKYILAPGTITTIINETSRESYPVLMQNYVDMWGIAHLLIGLSTSLSAGSTRP
jgi:hypothetical protein